MPYCVCPTLSRLDKDSPANSLRFASSFSDWLIPGIGIYSNSGAIY